MHQLSNRLRLGRLVSAKEVTTLARSNELVGPPRPSVLTLLPASITAQLDPTTEPVATAFDVAEGPPGSFHALWLLQSETTLLCVHLSLQHEPARAWLREVLDSGALWLVSLDTEQESMLRHAWSLLPAQRGLLEDMLGRSRPNPDFLTEMVESAQAATFLSENGVRRPLVPEWQHSDLFVVSARGLDEPWPSEAFDGSPTPSSNDLRH